MEGHKFRIEATAGGRGTQLFMDGQPIKGVTKYSLSASADRPTRLVLVLMPESVEVDGRVERVARVGHGS